MGKTYISNTGLKKIFNLIKSRIADPIHITSVTAFGLNKTQTSIGLITNNWQFTESESYMMKPVSSGIYLKKKGYYKIDLRAVLTVTENKRAIVGIRVQLSDGSSTDSSDGWISKISNMSDVYQYSRSGLYQAGTYIRPIAGSSESCIVHSAALTITSLKEF